MKCTISVKCVVSGIPKGFDDEIDMVRWLQSSENISNLSDPTRLITKD